MFPAIKQTKKKIFTMGPIKGSNETPIVDKSVAESKVDEIYNSTKIDTLLNVSEQLLKDDLPLKANSPLKADPLTTTVLNTIPSDTFLPVRRKKGKKTRTSFSFNDLTEANVAFRFAEDLEVSSLTVDTSVNASRAFSRTDLEDSPFTEDEFPSLGSGKPVKTGSTKCWNSSTIKNPGNLQNVETRSPLITRHNNSPIKKRLKPKIELEGEDDMYEGFEVIIDEEDEELNADLVDREYYMGKGKDDLY
jgi:hypothetical protein